MGFMSWIFYVFFPVMLHLVISEITAILAGNVSDSAARTALSAVLVLPFAIWMYWQDKKQKDKPSQEKRNTEQRITEQRLWCCLGMAVLCLLSGGILNILWSRILNLLRITSYFSNETQEALLTSNILMQLLGPGLLVPLTEELVFRGLFYARIRTRLQVRQAVFFSALLFALYHGNPVQMIYAFPMALILAVLYERSSNLAYPVLFHMGANLAAILLTFL